jgi:ParB/RepB/Spo0J family partition protein
MALIENIQREDLNPLEEARGLRRLTEEFGMTHESAARAVGRSRSATTNLLRLLNLSEPVQQLLSPATSRWATPALCSRSTAPARSSRPTRSSPRS